MYKTWIDLNREAAAYNAKVFRGKIGPETKLWAVVKSNAYGHGLIHFAKLADENGVDGFCVDSVIEGVKLRENGIKKFILVLGPTHNELMQTAVDHDLTVSISNASDLDHLLSSKTKPNFHLKVDTGMHRQGFFVDALADVFIKISNSDAKNSLKGIFSHFASAKDVNYPSFTEQQFVEFDRALVLAKSSGFDQLVSHISATSGTLLNKKYHLDAVRIGIGLMGYMPSKEFEMQLKDTKLKPVLSWYALISDVKKIKKDSYVGYDLTERVPEETTIAVIPIGYWHGFAWRLSSIGSVLVGGKRARVLGRVSMDLIVADVTNIPCEPGDKVTLLNESYTSYDMARQIGSSQYEILTRINPLIKRNIV